MLSIIDNVQLKRDDPTINPWLQTVLEKTERFEGDKFVARLTHERRPSSIIYSLESSRNKTMAQLSKKGDKIRIETFRREQPNPERFIKPEFAPVSAALYEDTPEGLTAAAKALHDVLGTPTPYSLKTVLKAKVYCKPYADDPWAFHGGLIAKIIYDGNDLCITTDTGQVYDFTFAAFAGKTIPKLLKYLVVDKRQNAEVINVSEFDFYFEMRSINHAQTA